MIPAWRETRTSGDLRVKSPRKIRRVGAALFHPGSTQSTHNTSHFEDSWVNTKKKKKKSTFFSQKELLLWNIIPFPGEHIPTAVGCVLPLPPWGAPPASTTSNPTSPSPTSAISFPAPPHTLAPCQDSRAGKEPGAAGAQSVSPKSSAESFKEPLALIPDSSSPKKKKNFTGEDSSAEPVAQLFLQPLFFFFFQEKSFPLLFQLISATFQASAPPKSPS